MLQREEHQTLKALEILSAKTSKKSAVEREDQEPYWNQKKNTTPAKMDNKPIIYKLLKDFINKKRTYRVVVTY